MNINRRTFNQYIADSDFRTLFIREMMWNNPQGQTSFDITVDEITFRFEQIAHRSGFQVLTCEVEEIPSSSMAKKIDTRLRRQANDYICIYFLPNTQHHLWVAPVNKVEKRDLVLVEYASAEAASFLYEKMDALSFDLDDKSTIMDVKERVQGAFLVNSEKITKDFYTGFRKEHTRFVNYITGMDDDIEPKKNHNKQWYTSVMLNRLMFCYFIQKKGFLDLNFNYLTDKLAWVQREKGENRFYDTFYKGFLRSLFHNGLNSPRHERDFQQKYGRIPYLNGGMFDEHELEKKYPNLDISDEAFIGLFAFFDNWNWHLDDRLTANGKDINPDVLGYIFEQYINDRAQMGAYYTKEDITEYIGRNTIVPFLLDATKKTTEKAFKPQGEVWSFLKASSDRYIYDAVKHGHETPIPEHIAVGIDTTQPNLLERRSRWNERTPEPWALPTEIWRETVERLQRYDSILQKIKKGEITEINDFITYNLDIRQFVYDFLQHTEDHLFVKHFYASLQKVSILDPTCGSGAFLFAALNILEPLYEVCIARMQDWNAGNPKLFEDELKELNGKYRSNIRYFIYKSIILRNLYGVDIMVEATEIAKLRLFLKMVAVVDVNPRDPNLGLDPLPDIDFNIRCGNTLVGYATEKEMEEGVKYMDMFARQEFETKVYDEIDVVSSAYDTFRKVQLEQDADLETFKNAKKQLKERLAKLNEILNQSLHAATASGTNYDSWKKSHQPFHWLAEFYDIIYGNGGFDVIIGNPPYVVWRQQQLREISQPQQVIEAGNLYSAILFRCKSIYNENSFLGMIVPISYISTVQQRGVRKYLEKERSSYYSSYDIRPDHLFDGAAQRLTIFVTSPQGNSAYIDKQLRWYTIYRPYLFNTIRYYSTFETEQYLFRVNDIARSIISKILGRNKFVNSTLQTYWVATTANNYIKAVKEQPRYTTNGVPSSPSGWREVFSEWGDIKNVIPVINSTLFYFIWKASSDGFNLPTKFSKDVLPHLLDNELNLISLYKKLIESMIIHSESHVRNQKTTGRTEIQLFRIKPVKPIVDEIDKVLAKHYGFTEEELDFIINYDIKYRMGDELDNN